MKHLIYGHGWIRVEDIVFISEFNYEYNPSFYVIFNNLFGRTYFNLYTSINNLNNSYDVYDSCKRERLIDSISLNDITNDIRDFEPYKQFLNSYTELLNKFKENNG